MRGKTHILVIDEEGIVRDGLCALLRRDDTLHLDGAFASAREAVRAGGNLRPSLLIVDFPTVMKSGPQTIGHLKGRWPGVSVLALSASGEGETIEAARSAGANGYVLRNDRRGELFKAIQALSAGEHYISASVLELPAPPSTRRTLTQPARRGEGAGMLTNREQQVIALIAEGYRTREMAEMLALSHKTVERHRTNLMRKLGVRSATGVVAYALTHGYVEY
jgi:DNA-binding NarL/FixJ family response regulator